MLALTSFTSSCEKNVKQFFLPKKILIRIYELSHAVENKWEDFLRQNKAEGKIIFLRTKLIYELHLFIK